MDAHTTWLLTNFVAALLLPPLSLILLGGVGLVVLGRRPRLGKVLLGASLVSLYLLATPLVADSFLGLLENDVAPLRSQDTAHAGAIVILGGGIYRDAPEYGHDAAGSLTLERLQYGAKLHRETGLPILVTGGNPEGGAPEAEAMRSALQDQFGLPVKWLETRALNTAQNARLSAEILKKAGVKKVLVVTHAWHMQRARYAFAQTALEIVPAPTRFTKAPRRDGGYRLFDFVPNARALTKSYFALHELVGLVWYRLTL